MHITGHGLDGPEVGAGHPLGVKFSEVHCITGHKGPEGEYRYRSTLSLTLALDGGK